MTSTREQWTRRKTMREDDENTGRKPTIEDLSRHTRALAFHSKGTGN